MLKVKATYLNSNVLIHILTIYELTENAISMPHKYV